MLGRHRNRFLSQLDRSKLEKAIHEGERTTTGSIRVAVLPRLRGPLEHIAELTAYRLGLTALPQHNGALIVVVPGRRMFHVWGDRALHEKLGDAFWTSLAARISSCFKAGDFNGGLLAGIEATGKELAAHFPAGPGAAKRETKETVLEE
ncbi:MAG: TPM domain-containing protein [Acidobacteriota bacterium]